MGCTLCGRPNATFGDGHLCVADGGVMLASPGSAPTSGWRVTSWTLLALTIAYLLACVAKIVLLVQDYGFVDRFTATSGSVDLAELNRLAASERVVGTIVQLLVLGYLVGFVGWFAMIWQMVARNGLDPRTALRHWTIITFAVSTLVSLVVAFLTRNPTVNTADLASARDALLAFDRNQIVFTIVRMAVGGLLIAVVCVLRRRVRTLIFGPLESIIQRRTQPVDQF
jgi:hypothetical protein